MKHKFKRAISAALACVMVLALLPASALAKGKETVDRNDKGWIKFVIVNGTWTGLSFSSDSDGEINDAKTEVTFPTYKATNKTGIGYVYVCGSTIENMLMAILSGNPSTYIIPKDGYYAAGQSWSYTGGLTGSTKDANGQMAEIGAITASDGKQHSAVHNYDSTDPINGFAKETTYTLTLQPIEYTVKYELNGGNGSISDPNTYYHSNVDGTKSTITVTSQVPTKEGYVFDGWELVGSNDTVDTSINVDSYWKNTDVVGTVIDGTGVFTLQAKWVEQYTVTYDPNGGTLTVDGNSYTNASMYTVTEKKGTDHKVISETPTRTGYKFDSWYDGSTQYVAGNTISSTTTLTAKWTANEAKIVFVENGGTEVNDLTGTTDAVITATLPTTTRTGYTFEGWYANADLSGDKVTALPSKYPAGTTTYYAKWTANEATIAFEENGGSTVADLTGTTDATISSRTLPTTTKVGYTFGGWYDNSSFTGTALTQLPEKYPAGTTTYYANWKANSYTVKFDANGGSGSMTDQTFTFDEEKALTANAFTKEGYTFSGWMTTANGTTVAYTDGQSVKNLTATNGATVTLYAKWTANTDTPYTVEHYTEQADGTFALKETEDLKGTTDTTATAKPKTYEGFVLDESIVGTVKSGTITGDGQLVLKLYYVTDTWSDQENTDEKGDGIPDKYQVLINYVSANENQGTVDPAKEVVTLYKQNDNGAGERTIAAADGSTATPKSGYTFVNWIDDDGTEVATTAQYVPSVVNAVGGTTYTFTANFTAIYYPPVVIPDPTIKVKGLNTVDHVTYIIGVGNDKVNPMGTITRAEIAAIYFRLMTDEFRSANWSTENRFKDVPDNAWYTMAILTLDKAGVITDSNNGNFRPNEPITRAELAVMAAQFCTVTGNIPRTSFKDVPADHWAAKEIALIEYAGWIEGYAGYFRPDDNLTRAEAVTIVNRMLQRGAEDENMLPNMVTFVDNTPDMWYYEAIQEAANCHDYTRTTKLLTGETFRGEKWTALLEATDWAALEKAWIEANS